MHRSLNNRGYKCKLVTLIILFAHSIFHIVALIQSDVGSYEWFVSIH